MELNTPDLVVRARAVTATSGRRRFYPTMAGLAIITVFVGFAPRFYERALSAAPGPRPFVLVHAAVFSAWMFLFRAERP